MKKGHSPILGRYSFYSEDHSLINRATGRGGGGGVMGQVIHIIFDPNTLYVVELLHANLNCHLFAKHLSIGLTGTAEHA